MDRLLEESGADEDGSLVFVDCLDNYYDEASEIPVDDCDPSSPFIGKTPDECYRLLIKLRKDTESEIMIYQFAIMDERSAQDDTVLLVCYECDENGENETLATLRATFQALATALKLYMSGHSTVAEDADRAAQEGDNVYRGAWSSGA